MNIPPPENSEESENAGRGEYHEPVPIKDTQETASDRSRRNFLVWIVAVAVLSGGGALGAAQFIRSPAQKAAEADAPEPSVITAAVESRRIVDTVVVRGRISAAQSVEVAPQAGGAPTGDSGGGGKPVVTGVRVKAGDTVRGGQVLLEISGRPVFVLAGELPVYRDLKPGGSGRDVEQLQKALSALGFPSAPDKPGEYGAGTRDAVGAFYASIGYEAPESPDASEEQVTAAEERVTQAERAVAAAESAVDTAEEAAAAQKKARSPSSVPPSAPASAIPSSSAQPSPSSSQAPPASSQPTGGSPGSGPGAAGQQALTQARQQLAYAEEDLTRAEDALTKLNTRQGAMLPASEVVYLNGFPGRVDAVGVRVGGEATQGSAITISAGALVVSAELAPHEQGLVRAGMKVRILSEATGTEVSGAATSVADVPTTVTEDGSQGGGPGSSTGRTYTMMVTPDTPLDAKLAGQDVRLTIEAASSDGEVLVVPLAAVSAGADGSAVVTVLGPDGQQARVRVRPGTTGDGYVQVTPVGAELAPGARVVIGVRRGADASPIPPGSGAR